MDTCSTDDNCCNYFPISRHGTRPGSMPRLPDRWGNHDIIGDRIVVWFNEIQTCKKVVKGNLKLEHGGNEVKAQIGAGQLSFKFQSLSGIHIPPLSVKCLLSIHFIFFFSIKSPDHGLKEYTSYLVVIVDPNVSRCSITPLTTNK